MPTLHPFLLFDGRAEEAIRFYVSIFPGSTVADIARYDVQGPGNEGSVAKASFTIAGQTVFCTDSVVRHPFTFTPAFSLFLDCDSEEELRRICGLLLEGGAELMPLDNCGFSRQFAWVTDRFGVSWQLNLP